MGSVQNIMDPKEMVGKIVVGVDPSGNAVAGTVTSVQTAADKMYFQLDTGHKVEVGSLSSVLSRDELMGQDVSDSPTDGSAPTEGIVTGIVSDGGKEMLELDNGKHLDLTQVTNIQEDLSSTAGNT